MYPSIFSEHVESDEAGFTCICPVRSLIVERIGILTYDPEGVRSNDILERVKLDHPRMGVRYLDVPFDDIQITSFKRLIGKIGAFEIMRSDVPTVNEFLRGYAELTYQLPLERIFSASPGDIQLCLTFKNPGRVTLVYQTMELQPGEKLDHYWPMYSKRLEMMQ